MIHKPQIVRIYPQIPLTYMYRCSTWKTIDKLNMAYSKTVAWHEEVGIFIELKFSDV